MSATGLEVFDRTLQATHAWLDDIMADLGPDRHVAWHALGGVLHALRDKLPLELAVHLGAQLPLLVRGLYYDQWRIGAEPNRTRTLEAFLDQVGEGLKNIRPVNRMEAARSVLRVLTRHVSAGQVRHVRDSLPEEVRAIWPDEPSLKGAP